MPGCLLLPLSAEKILEGVHGKTGFAKLPPATSPLPWKAIFNPGQFTHCDSQQHLIYSCPAHKRKWQLQRKIHSGAAVQPMLLPHPRADLIQTELFSVEGFTTCYACMKAGLFCNYHCNTMLLVFKMFSLLKESKDLQTSTLQHPPRFHRRQTSFPGILTGHTIEDNKKMTKTSTKLLQYISAIRSQQTA